MRSKATHKDTLYPIFYFNVSELVPIQMSYELLKK